MIQLTKEWMRKLKACSIMCAFPSRGCVGRSGLTVHNSGKSFTRLVKFNYGGHFTNHHQSLGTRHTRRILPPDKIEPATT